MRARERDTRLHAGAAGAALVGTLYPPAALLGTGAILYLAIPTLRLTWKDLRDRRISPYLTDAILIPALLLSGNTLVAALKGLMGGLNWKLIKQTEHRSQRELVDTFGDRPQRLWLRCEGREVQVGFDELRKGDVLILSAGEIIPVDGIIQQGQAMIDQQRLTGEALEVEGDPGEQVLAATLVLSGRIDVLSSRTGEDVVASQLGELLRGTTEYKDSQIVRGSRIASDVTPLHLMLGGLTWGLLGPTAALWRCYGRRWDTTSLTWALSAC